MSALGIAIGIATMISVIGISASGQEHLLRQLDQLGTNLLRVEPGKALMSDPVKLHPDAALMVRRISGVTGASVTGTVDTSVRRTDRIPKEDTGGLTVQATSLDLLRTLDGRVAAGRWLDEAIARQPAVVLGTVAAQRLGVSRTGVQV
ncbi:ABC transporter permease [Nonomuraea bangladeshensis]|uniref:ABC transporter permease n=1 Tax=Nonomuraea bangladeshensis TaxID=404385 RepID=UPI003C2EFC36